MYRIYKIIAVLICLLLLDACSRYLFVPQRGFPVTPDKLNITYDTLFLKGEDGARLHGWKLHAQGEKRGSILFFHGNGDNVSTQLPNTWWLAKQGYDLYVFDYRGYGLSEGVPDLDLTIKDMERMIGRALEDMDEGKTNNNEKLIVMGHSLGASMAIYVVAHSQYRDRLDALITVEAFSDYHDITQETLANSWLLWAFQWPLSFTVSNAYNPHEAAPLVSPIPLLILHSERDEMIDIYHARRLYEAAREPKALQLIDSGHNDIFLKKENRQVLLDYLNSMKGEL